MNPQEPRLESWKEIGAYLQRDATTARRWEKEEGLPVHRHSHKSRASVYAYPSEIDAWRAGRKVVAEPAPRPLWKIPAFAVTMAMALIMVGNGVRPQKVQAQDGSGVRQIWSSFGGNLGAGSAVSRDGRYVTFTAASMTARSISNLAVHDLVTGKDVTVTDNHALGDQPGKAVFSPDAKQVAYVWYTAGLMEIRVLAWNSTPVSQPRTIYSSKDSAFSPYDWSPDGKWIAGQLSRQDRTMQLALMSPVDGALRGLKTLDWAGASRIYFSPDGKYLAYDRRSNADSEKRDAFVLAVDGSSEIPAVVHPADDRAAGWSPDGKQLLFISDRNGSASLWSQGFANGKTQGNPELLRANFASNQYAYLGPVNSGKLYFVVLGGAPKVVITDFDWASGKAVPGTTEQLPRGIHAGWSHDGKLLAYDTYHLADNGVSLTILEMKSGRRRELNPNLQYFRWPRWSPDDRSVLLDGTDPKGRSGIFRVDAQTGETEMIALCNPGETYESAQWLADGKRIIYLNIRSDRDRAIIEREVPSGKERVIVQGPDLGGGGVQLGFNASPDERTLVFARFDRTTDKGAISVVPMAGGTPKVLVSYDHTNLGRVWGWSPDGKSILYSLGKDGADFAGEQTPWMIPATGGEPRKLDFGEPFVTELEFQPGGKKAAYWVNNQTAEQLWVLENFLPGAK